MFLVWSLFAVNLVLAVFQFLLIGAFGAISAIYSRFGGEHANSIRWTRQGGYPEMLKSLYNSWKTIPKSTKVAMVITIFASLAASLADKGAAYFITLAERQINASFIMVNSPQFIPISGTSLELSGWSTNIRYGANIVDAMARMINDTSNIPDAAAGRIYIPQTYEYEIGCNQAAILALDYKTPQLRLRDNGCMEVFYFFQFPGRELLFANATVIKRLGDRWSITVPITDIRWLYEISVAAILHNNSTSLSTTSSFGRQNWVYLQDGITSLPETITSKGVSPTGETLVLSISNIPFSSSTVQRFRNVSTAAFDNYNDLFQAMEVSINNATLRSKTNMFTEARVVNSTIETLVCYSSNLPGLMCAYNIISIVSVKQQPLNSIIAEARQGRPLPQNPDLTIAMRIRHTITTVNGTRQSISLSTMKNATSAAAYYLASLGQNFYMDWNASELYIIYDIRDTQSGLEIPFWLILCIAVTMMVCLGMWASTEYFMDGRYTSSLHTNIAMQLAARLKSSAPLLMRSKVDPLEFEEIPIVPHDIQQGADINTYTTPFISTLEYPNDR
ncbi:hypothetical protein K457DRAFT_130471 [Linnemannia elongata AG-77]|uniref:Transmembrane protein n=1 Tax=Linnemannia elongata AG-77 TaxID=1314771 RepID=A0A197JEU6_9FUNG|nr:hypothetical protein K457DRAFT_130471 [Linnemannia elongata AG-77]